MAVHRSKPLVGRPLFLLLILLVILFYWRNQDKQDQPLDHHRTESGFIADQAPFFHGVASGDPTINKVIIWTRVTPDNQGTIDVEWEIDTVKDFSGKLQRGINTTDSSRDYTVKVDVSGLKPNTFYYYRFKVHDKFSPVGRTRTAPGGDNPVRLAVISCTNHEEGYFNVLRQLSERNDLTAVLHLGDYIYEYGPGTYGDTSLKERQHLPPHEIVSIDDYRTRYSQYRLDPDFQRAHQLHPFITIWDDHEISNNAYKDGAQNHQEEEGDYMKRKNVARQVYYEWLPVRGDENSTLYRQFYLSKQTQLIMLDERLAGRTQQVADTSDSNWSSADQQMLGREQFNWLIGLLSGSQAKWKVIGNQVIFSPLSHGSRNKQHPLNMDAWDGYPAERKRLLDFIHLGDLQNIVFVTGDTHCSWAFEVPYDVKEYKNSAERKVVAVEFGTPSITSKNLDAYMSGDSVQSIERAYLRDPQNPHLKYVNMRDHGYLELYLDSLEAVGTWYYTTDLKSREAGIFESASFRVKDKSQVLTKNED